MSEAVGSSAAVPAGREAVIVSGPGRPSPAARLAGHLFRRRIGRHRDQGGARARWHRRDQVDYVIMGQVLQAGAGQIPRGRRPWRGVPCRSGTDGQQVCLSGLDAIALAAQLVRLGECDVVVAAAWSR